MLRRAGAAADSIKSAKDTCLDMRLQVDWWLTDMLDDAASISRSPNLAPTLARILPHVLRHPEQAASGSSVFAEAEQHPT